MGSSVTSIEDWAFKNCTGLTSIKSYVTNVFVTGKKPFNNCNNATLYVPEGLVAVYQSTPDWNLINFIEEMPVIHDVNGDGSTDIADVTGIIDKLLGLSSNEGYYYDINNDEHIDIMDVITLIDVIMGK